MLLRTLPHSRSTIEQKKAELVLVMLQGGLGNQLFQYATGRALALRYGSPLKLNTTRLNRGRARPYRLDAYRIAASVATSHEIDTFAGPTYVEPHHHFDPRILDQAPPIHIVGYWQSERYFKHISQTIRREFTPIHCIDLENAHKLEEISSSTSVAVHVRRGDYVTNPTTTAYHGVLSLNYYRQAMHYILARVPEAVFYIFSDDHRFAAQNINYNCPVVHVTNNAPDQDVRDLQLMSAARHHIIANSSFSWWGAWLSNSEGQIVVAPTPWFRSQKNNTKDILPAGWETLPARVMTGVSA
jgi:hypothetical protein